MNELLITLLLQIILRTDACNIPNVPQVQCEQYRIDKELVWLCDTDYKGIDWELLFRQRKNETWRLVELNENGRPSFKRGQASGVWDNIYKIAITGIGKPSYCSVPELDQNRHN